MNDSLSVNDRNRDRQRQQIRERRRGIPSGQRRDAELQLARHLWALAAFRRARHVSIYFAVDGEASLRTFMQGEACRHKQIYAPVLARNRLRFALLQPGGALRLNRFGIPEPSAGPYIDARSIDLVLTPLVAFDDQGQRLGMGGGFYDRSFEFLMSRSIWWKPKLVGIAFEAQHLPRIDSQSWDVTLHCAVTESNTYQFS